MKAISINAQDIQTSLRLDGSFHLSPAVLIEKAIIKKDFQSLSFYVDRIFTAGRNKRVYTTKNFGYPYLSNSNVISQNPFSSCKYNSTKYGYDENALLKEGMIVTGRVGAIGQTAYITKEFEENKAMGSDNIIRIVPKDKNLSGFLYAYIASKIGNTFLWKYSTGGVQPYINEEMVGSIPVPIFPTEKQQLIHDLITESAELRVGANNMLKEVDSLFIKHLNLDQLATNKFQTGSRKITEIRNSFQVRLDAPAFINYGVKLLESLKKKFSFELLGNCNAKVSRPGIFKRIYVKSGGFPYIKGSELGLNNPFANCVRLSKTKTPFLDELELTEDQILITCAGSVGNARIITKEFQDQNAIGSQDIIRIKCNSDLFTSEYIYAYLKLPFIFDFIQSLKYGSVIERVEPFHIDQIPVLIPTKEFSELITQKIKLYKNLTYKAFCKENQAIQLVEKEIEQWQN